MSKEATKKFVENNGFICNKCGKVIVDGHKHKNEEDLCDQCKISDLETKLAQAKMNERFEKEKKENAFKLIEELKQQLAEKDEEIKDLNYRLDLKFVNYTNSESIKFLEYQDKISFAVEQLTLFKNTIVNKMNNPYNLNIKHILSDFDNQIKQLKEGK